MRRRVLGLVMVLVGLLFVSSRLGVALAQGPVNW
jgi:hypothetical protein